MIFVMINVFHKNRTNVCVCNSKAKLDPVRLPDGSFKCPEGEFKGIVWNNVITVITGVITIIKRVITVITGLFSSYTITPPGGIFV